MCYDFGKKLVLVRVWSTVAIFVVVVVNELLTRLLLHLVEYERHATVNSQSQVRTNLLITPKQIYFVVCFLSIL